MPIRGEGQEERERKKGPPCLAQVAAPKHEGQGQHGSYNFV